MRTFEPKGRPNTQTSEAATSIAASRAAGHPLPPVIRADFESLLGHDFAQVRVHRDNRAGTAARMLDARAFTIGSDVFFGKGNYAPATADGRQLLAHELTHVMQRQERIQRAPIRPAPSGSSTPWDQVRGAQPKLEKSFNVYKPLPSPQRPWMWGWRPTAKDCYNKNLKPEHQRAFRNAYEAMVRASLWGFVGVVIEPVPSAVQGIKFNLDPANDLKKHVTLSTKYCRDPWAKGTKWRQVVTGGTPGLHIILPAKGNAEVHIDRISPITGRDASGLCVKSSFGHQVQHGKRELLGISRSDLMLGGTFGVATSSGRTAGIVGVDITLLYNFLSTLNQKLHLQGRAQVVVNNALASFTVGLGGEVEYRNLGAYAFGGLTVGRLTSNDLGRRGSKVAGVTGTVGAYYRLRSLSAQLGIEYSALKGVVSRDPDFHQFVAKGVLRF